MADIELVIKIPEEMWERVKEGYVPYGNLWKTYRNGKAKRHTSVEY